MGRLSEEDFADLSVLAARAQAGDTAAYDTLLRGLYPFVEAMIRSRLGSVVDVDDVVQECLLGVHKSLPTYLPGRSIRPWLMAIIRYKVADHFRFLARKKEQPLVENLDGVTNVGPATNSPDETRSDETVDVNMLINALSEPLRRAVVLTKVEGMSSAEAARREGISDAALRKRVSRAYTELAKAARRELEREHGER